MKLHLGQGGESLEDTAKILATYGDGFMLRTDSDEKIEQFKNYSTIPIINGLSPSSHPTQVLFRCFYCRRDKKQINFKIKYLLDRGLKQCIE